MISGHQSVRGFPDLCLFFQNINLISLFESTAFSPIVLALPLALTEVVVFSSLENLIFFKYLSLNESRN